MDMVAAIILVLVVSAIAIRIGRTLARDESHNYKDDGYTIEQFHKDREE